MAQRVRANHLRPNTHAHGNHVGKAWRSFFVWKVLPKERPIRDRAENRRTNSQAWESTIRRTEEERNLATPIGNRRISCELQRCSVLSGAQSKCSTSAGRHTCNDISFRWSRFLISSLSLSRAMSCDRISSSFLSTSYFNWLISFWSWTTWSCFDDNLASISSCNEKFSVACRDVALYGVKRQNEDCSIRPESCGGSTKTLKVLVPVLYQTSQVFNRNWDLAVPQFLLTRRFINLEVQLTRSKQTCYIKHSWSNCLPLPLPDDASRQSKRNPSLQPQISFDLVPELEF